MWRRMAWAGGGVIVTLGVLAGLAEASIWYGVERSAETAEARFGGARTEALARRVECGTCPMMQRNRAVWALGQMREKRVRQVLERHFDGRKCQHETRLCQYELRKAIGRLGELERR